MTTRETQFYLRKAESVRKEGGEVTRLYAATAGEPVLVFSSKNAGDVARVRDRILASLAWSDAAEAKWGVAMPAAKPALEEWET